MAKGKEKKDEKPQEQASDKVFRASLNRYGFIHVGKRFREALGWPANVNVHLEATVEGGKVTFAIKSGSDAN